MFLFMFVEKVNISDDRKVNIFDMSGNQVDYSRFFF